MRCSLLVFLTSLALAACSDQTAPGAPSSGAPSAGTERAPAHALPVDRNAGPAEGDAPDNAAGEAADAGPAPLDVPPIRLGRPALLDFSRDNCLPCELMRPWVDDLRRRHEGTVAVIEVNIDRAENKALAVFFKARAVPLQVYVDADGKEVSRSTGIATLAQMQNQLERLGFLKKSGSAR
jgi:thiol-disulfide isomerase/thioredoxin